MLQIERIIGHRGASAYAPENTIASFERALASGCRFIEFDVILSHDGEPFIFHDYTLRRTTNGRGRFEDKPSATLRQLDAGSWFSKQFAGEKIPTLQSAIQWLTASNVTANIEIKPEPGKGKETTLAVLSTLNRYWPTTSDWPLLSSFDHDVLRLCRDLSPEVPLGLLLDKWKKDWYKTAEEIQCFSVHLSLKAATKAHLSEIKSKGYRIFVYTVNSKRQANKLFNLGVDAVFSDYPDLLS